MGLVGVTSGVGELSQARSALSRFLASPHFVVVGLGSVLGSGKGVCVLNVVMRVRARDRARSEERR